MVCIRCKMVVKDELAKLGLHYTTVKLGEADILENISVVQHDQFRDALLKSGLELMDNKRSVLIEKIKNVIIELVHYSEEPLAIKFSEFLSQKLHHDYTYLSNLFSEVQGTTIEKFFIAHKIERVKELLVYNELNLTEIAISCIIAVWHTFPPSSKKYPVLLLLTLNSSGIKDALCWKICEAHDCFS